jgi:hypothetical protein
MPRSCNLKIAARSQPFRYQFRRTHAETGFQIVWRDDEILAPRILSANNDMRVSVTCIVVVHGDPIEARAEVPFHLRHQGACMFAQISKRHAVFWRHDDTELMTVILTAFQEVGSAWRFTLTPVEFTTFSVSFNPIALDVMKVRTESTVSSDTPGARDVELDNDPPHAERGYSAALKFQLPRRCRSPAQTAPRIAACLTLRAKPRGGLAQAFGQPPPARLSAIPDSAQPWREVIINRQDRLLLPGACTMPNGCGDIHRSSGVSKRCKGRLKIDVQTRR